MLHDTRLKIIRVPCIIGIVGTSQYVNAKSHPYTFLSFDRLRTNGGEAFRGTKLYLYMAANSFRISLLFFTASSSPCLDVFLPESTFSISASMMSRIATRFPIRSP